MFSNIPELVIGMEEPGCFRLGQPVQRQIACEQRCGDAMQTRQSSSLSCYKMAFLPPAVTDCCMLGDEQLQVYNQGKYCEPAQ